MIEIIKKLIYQAKSKIFKKSTITYIIPPEIDFSDIEFDFNKRTYSFAYYQKKLSSRNKRLLHWIGSIDYSGYQREKSLNYLVSHYQIGDENRILLRLEDWVKNVQQLAKKWVHSNFNDLSLAQINKQYKLILYLARKEILQNDESLNTINESLINKASEVNNHTFYQLNSNLRRYIYNLKGTQNPIFRKRILYDSDPFNRIILLKKYKIDELSQEEVNKFKIDKSSYVKRNFILSQIQNQIMPSREDMIQYCFDENVGIRDIAKFYLLKSYGIDPYNLYKKQSDSRYYYIAEYAKKEDLSEFIKGLESKNSNIKYLCLKAICNIDYSLLKNMNPVLLLSANRKIRKLACRYLPKVLLIEKLLKLKNEIFSIGSNGQLVYLNMIYMKSIWHFINESLKILINDPSEAIMKFISNKYYYKPYYYEKLPPALKNEIMEMIETLSTNENQYIKSFIKEIQFTIKVA